MLIWPLIFKNLGVVAIEKGAFGSPSNMVANFAYFIFDFAKQLLHNPKPQWGLLGMFLDINTEMINE